MAQSPENPEEGDVTLSRIRVALENTGRLVDRFIESSKKKIGG